MTGALNILKCEGSIIMNTKNYGMSSMLNILKCEGAIIEY